MSDKETKFCPHCRAQYQTILNTCVYCNSHMRTVSGPPCNPEVFLVVVTLAAILLFSFITLNN